MFRRAPCQPQQIGSNGLKWPTAGTSFTWLRSLVEGRWWAATDEWLSGENELNKAYVLKVEYGHKNNSPVPTKMGSSVTALCLVYSARGACSWPFPAMDVTCKAVRKGSIRGGFHQVYLSTQLYQHLTLDFRVCCPTGLEVFTRVQSSILLPLYSPFLTK